MTALTTLSPFDVNMLVATYLPEESERLEVCLERVPNSVIFAILHKGKFHSFNGAPSYIHIIKPGGPGTHSHFTSTILWHNNGVLTKTIEFTLHHAAGPDMLAPMSMKIAVDAFSHKLAQALP